MPGGDRVNNPPCWTDMGVVVRWMAAGTLIASLCACGHDREPLPPPPRPALFIPPDACIEPPQPPPDALFHGSEGRECIPARYTMGLPLEVSVVRGRVAAFRLYSQCEGRVYEVEPRVHECLRRAMTTWRFDYAPPTCPGTKQRPDDVQHTQMYILPRAPRSRRDGMQAGIGAGCSAA